MLKEVCGLEEVSYGWLYFCCGELIYVNDMIDIYRGFVVNRWRRSGRGFGEDMKFISVVIVYYSI